MTGPKDNSKFRYGGMKRAISSYEKKRLIHIDDRVSPSPSRVSVCGYRVTRRHAARQSLHMADRFGLEFHDFDRHMYVVASHVRTWAWQRQIKDVSTSRQFDEQVGNSTGLRGRSLFQVIY